MQVVRKLFSSRLYLFILLTVVIQLGVLGVAKFDNSPPPKSLAKSSETSVIKNTETPEEFYEENIRVEAPLSDLTDQSATETEEALKDTINTGENIERDPQKRVSLTVDKEEEIIEYKVKPGDTLTRIWSENCDDSTGGIKAAKAFKKAGIALNTIKAGEVIEIKLSPENTIEALTKNLDDGKKIILTKDDEAYAHEIIHPIITESQKTVSGSIISSLSESASRNKVPAEVVDDFVDLFGGRVEFSRDLQPGDRFSVVYKERTNEDGMHLNAGDIESASLVNGDDFLAIIRFVDDKGNVRYYDEKGEPLGNYFLRYPVRFTRISSVFSRSRFHPILKRHRPHNGVDFAAPTGTPVRSVADGVVLKAHYEGGAGNLVKIKHSSRYSTAYLHLSKISSGLRPGTRVKRGQVIGKVGSTGYATGPHLHYSLYDYGKYVDPMKTELPKMPEDQQSIPDGLLRTTLEQLKAHHETLEMAQANRTTSQPLG